MGKEADKGNICAAGRRVFEDPMNGANIRD